MSFFLEMSYILIELFPTPSGHYYKQKSTFYVHSLNDVFGQ